MAETAGFVVCPNPGCDRRGDHFAYHQDTTLPIHCGGCNRELVPHPDGKSDVSVQDGPDLDALADVLADRMKARGLI